jgi:hypothetical protein
MNTRRCFYCWHNIMTTVVELDLPPSLPSKLCSRSSKSYPCVHPSNLLLQVSISFFLCTWFSIKVGTFECINKFVVSYAWSQVYLIFLILLWSTPFLVFFLGLQVCLSVAFFWMHIDLLRQCFECFKLTRGFVSIV